MTVSVLIVDDEVPLLKNFRRYLSSLGDRFNVVTATSAEEGLDVLKRQETVDVLLTDIKLPGMDGIELVRAAKTYRPHLPVVVMSAFGTAGLKRRAHDEGALTFLEKPVDLDMLPRTLEDTVGERSGWSGKVGGLDIFDVTQMLAMSGRSLAVRVVFAERSGILAFENGRLVHASSGKLRGEPAFYEMALWSGGTFEDISHQLPKPLPNNVQLPLSQLMIEAARRRDEALREASASDVFTAGPTPGTTQQPGDPERDSIPGTDHHDTKEDWHMAIKDHLQEFTGISGFKGVAIFTAQGEILESEVMSKYDIKSAGMFANNALLNAQKATDQMGVGRGNLVQVRAPQANVLMRCFNEATDFEATKEGKAHFHVIVVLDPEGNTGMAGMILDKVAGKIADELR